MRYSKRRNRLEVWQDSDQVLLRNLDGILDEFCRINFLFKKITDRVVAGESEAPQTEEPGYRELNSTRVRGGRLRTGRTSAQTLRRCSFTQSSRWPVRKGHMSLCFEDEHSVMKYLNL